MRLATREMANMAIAELKGRPLSRKTDDHGGQPRGPGQSLQIRFADSEAQKFVKACDKNKSVKMLHQGTLHEAPHMRQVSLGSTIVACDITAQTGLTSKVSASPPFLFYKQMHSEPLRQTPFVPLSRDPSFASISSCGSESYLPSWHVNDLAHHHQPMPVPPFLSHNVPTGSTGLPSWPGSVFNLVGSHSLHPIAPSVISNSDSFEHLRNLHMSTPIPPAGHPCAQGRGLPGPSARVDQNLDPVHGMLYVKGSAPETSSSRATTRLQEANSGVVPSSSHTLVGPTFNALSTPHPNPGDWSHRYADDFHRDRCDTPLPAFDGKANETQPLSHEDTASFQLTQDDNLQQSVRQDNPLPHMHAHHEYHVPASTSTASGMYTIAEGIRISDSPMPKSANPSAGPLGEGLMQPSARIRAHTTAGEPLDERRAAYFDTGSRFGVETNEIPSGCALARRSSAVEARLMSSENPLLLPTPPTAKSELPAIPAMPSVVDVASILPLSPTSPTSPMQSQRRLPVLSPPSVKPGHRKTKSELRDLQPYFDNLSLASDMSRADELSATTYSPTTSQGMPSASASSFAASTRAVNQTQATEVDTHVCDPAIFRDDVCCSDAADVFDALAASLRAGPLGVDMNGSEDRPYNETGAANRQPYTTPMERPRSAWTHRKHGSLPSIPQYKHVVFNNPLSSDVKERESRGTVETIIQQTEHAQGLSRFDATYTFGTSYETRSSAKERQRPPFTRSDTRTFSPEQE